MTYYSSNLATTTFFADKRTTISFILLVSTILGTKCLRQDPEGLRLKSQILFDLIVANTLSVLSYICINVCPIPSTDQSISRKMDISLSTRARKGEVVRSILHCLNNTRRTSVYNMEGMTFRYQIYWNVYIG